MIKNKGNKISIYDRPGWKLTALIATLLSGLSGLGAVAAIIIAVIALNSASRGTEELKNKLVETVDSLGSINEQMADNIEQLKKINESQEGLIEITNLSAKALRKEVEALTKQTEGLSWIAARQYEESRQIHFLSLVFLKPNGQFGYELYLDSADLVNGKQVDLYILNTGTISCDLGFLHLHYRNFLKLKFLKTNNVYPNVTSSSDSIIILIPFWGVQEPLTHPVWSTQDKDGNRDILTVNNLLYLGTLIIKADPVEVKEKVGGQWMEPLNYLIQSNGAEGDAWRELYICFDARCPSILKEEAWRRNLFDDRFR
jgi:hypothetical protein